MPRIQFATQTYPSKSPDVSAQRLVNLYAEREPPDAKTQVALFGVPGLNIFSNVGFGAIRGMDVMDGVLYAVSGTNLYSVDDEGNPTLLGSGILGSGAVDMANNGNQVVIVNGAQGYCYTLQGTQQVSAAAIVDGGTGYAVGDTYTIAGGDASEAAILTVTAESGGVITGVSIEQSGNYQSLPSNPVSQGATSGSGSGATFNLTWSGPPTGFAQITDPAFNPAFTVTFFDGYFIFDWAGTGKFFYSALYDGTTYNGLWFYTAEVQPSKVLAVINQQENLLIVTDQCIETWYDSGVNNDPFARYDGATIERGGAASQCTVKEDNAVFFLGNDLIFYRLDGILPSRKSTHAIEQAWQTYSTVADAICFSYTFEGHKMVNVIFPTANTSFVFDISTGLWHERESFKQSGQSYGRWRGNCSATIGTNVLIGDAFANNIGVLSSSDYTEFGNQILGQAVSPPQSQNKKRLFQTLFELDMETGVGLTTGQGSDPKILLDWSDDGGHTFKALQLWHSLGKIGEYGRRVRWTRLGNFRQRVLRITMSDPVRRTIMNAYAEFEPSDI